MTTPAPSARPLVEWLSALAVSMGVFLFAGLIELNERISAITESHEDLQLDELPAAFLAFAVMLSWISWRNNRKAQRELLLRLDAEDSLAAQRRELSELVRRTTTAIENERCQIAHELHDDLGQTLNAIKIEAVALRNLAPDPADARRRGAIAIIELSDRVYGSVRGLLGRLRPVALDELGLQGALEHIVAEWRARVPNIEFRLTGIDRLPPLEEPAAIALYRVCQESVTNALRHAAATRIDIGFDREDGKLHLKVADDGCGVELNQLQRGLGLLGMRERMENLGGRIEYRSRPNAGFEVTAQLPLTGTESLPT